MTGKELDITYDEYVNNQWIIKAIVLEDIFYFHKETTIIDRDINVQYYDVYSCSIIGNEITTIFSCRIFYKYGNKISISHINTIKYSIPNIILNINNDPSILSKLQRLTPNYSYSVGLVTNCYTTILGTYYNGTITAFVDNKLKQYVVNFETGAITETISIDISILAGIEARITALENA